MIYLDNAATTYPKPEEVYEALDKANRNAFNTGRGSYKSANAAQLIKDRVREKLLRVCNSNNGNVVFSNSATQALNNIIFGIDFKSGDAIYVSPFEHNSILRPLEEIKKRKNINIIVLPFDAETWEPYLNKIKDMFTINHPKAIFISQVSNVTGYLLPYDTIFDLGKEYAAINVLDASQGFGIVPIKRKTSLSYIVFAGHKSLYASFGIAGYIKLKNDKLLHNIFGGTGSDSLNVNMPSSFPDGYEAGSSNIVAICGLDSSLDWLKENNIYKKEKELTDYLINELNKIKKIKLFLPKDKENIFGVVSISVEGYQSSNVGNILDDEFNICVRTGYHCASLVHDFINSKESLGTVRISLNYFNTKDDIDSLIKALRTL